MKETLVISAYTCCGKTYASEHIKDYKMLDVNICDFKQIERHPNDEEIEEERKWWESSLHLMSTESHLNQFKKKTIRVDNPDFPNNFIQYIKENIGKVDVIFVDGDIKIRQLIYDAKIKFITVYPRRYCLQEYIGRMYLNNYDKKFIDKQISNWKKNTEYIYDPSGDRYFLLGGNEYISKTLIGICLITGIGVNKIEGNTK